MVAALDSWWTNFWPLASSLAVALVATWVVYRFQRREEREGVISALVAELELHDACVGGVGYSPGGWMAAMGGPSWADSPDLNKLVYKLSMVATDHAIEAGPALFIDRGLVRALVLYRQRADTLNRCIDDMSAFRANGDLWLPSTRQTALRDQLDVLAGMLHEGGIGNMAGDGANHHYHLLRRALRDERTASWWRRWAWFWFGVSRRAKDQPEAAW